MSKKKNTNTWKRAVLDALSVNFSRIDKNPQSLAIASSRTQKRSKSRAFNITANCW